MCFASVSQEPGSALIQTGEAGSLVSPGKFGCQCWLPERLYRGLPVHHIMPHRIVKMP